MSIATEGILGWIASVCSAFSVMVLPEKLKAWKEAKKPRALCVKCGAKTSRNADIAKHAAVVCYQCTEKTKMAQIPDMISQSGKMIYFE
jgi:Zn ribbon nucleic-acid-binding protein